MSIIPICGGSAADSTLRKMKWMLWRHTAIRTGLEILRRQHPPMCTVRYYNDCNWVQIIETAILFTAFSVICQMYIIMWMIIFGFSLPLVKLCDTHLSHNGSAVMYLCWCGYESPHLLIDTYLTLSLYMTQKLQFMVPLWVQLDVGSVQPLNCLFDSPTQYRDGWEMLSALHGGHEWSLGCHQREAVPQHQGTLSRKECSCHHAKQLADLIIHHKSLSRCLEPSRPIHSLRRVLIGTISSLLG